MRRSQIAVLSAFAALVLIVVAAVVAARIIVAQIGAGQYGTSAETESREADLTSGNLDLAGFDRVDARGVWEVTLVQGADWDVELDYPESLADQLRVRVEGDRLVLGYDRQARSWWQGFNMGGNRDRARATVVMPSLESVDLSGASKLDLSGFSGARLEITASGASEIDGRDGRYDQLSLTVSGASDVNFGTLVTADARIVLSGAGDVMLNMAGGDLSGTISGAGKVRYRGSVTERNVVVSGFSSVEALD